MNEVEMVEVLTHRMLTHENGREPMSLPLFLDVTKDQMDKILESKLPIALKCSAYSE